MTGHEEADRGVDGGATARKASSKTEAGLGAEPSLWLKVEERLGLLDDPVVLTYRSHGAPRWLRVKGRVLETNHVQTVEDRDEERSAWENALQTFRRLESDEIPGARIRAEHEGGAWETVTDEEGYFAFRLETDRDLDPGWHEVSLDVHVPLTGDRISTTAPVLVPSPRATYGVISDLDDTVVETGATDLLREIRMVFGHSAASRPPLAGVGALYRALAEGGPGPDPNPFFYVTLSGWNLYDLFDGFLEINDIPPGPFFMQDLSIVDDDSAMISHDAPKLERASILLENYADLDFILIGDSGQADAETYRRIVDRHPGRIRAIYIRDVTPDEETDRDERVEAIAREVRAKGVPMVLSPDSVAMAEHARDVLGVLDDAAVAEVDRETRERREDR